MAIAPVSMARISALKRSFLGVVHWSDRRRSFGGYVGFRHSAINDKVLRRTLAGSEKGWATYVAVDEAALVAGEEHNGLCLLDGLAEAAAR
jgi:hypothetical protein